jgi:hypothetical protein
VKGEHTQIRLSRVGTELPPVLISNVIDALAQSLPSPEVTEAAAKDTSSCRSGWAK